MKFITVCSLALVFLNQVFAKPADGCLQVYTVTDNDDCYSVAQRFQLSEKDFYAMNPGLHHSPQHMCDNLDTGKPYCVCMNEPCVMTADTMRTKSNATRTTTTSTRVSTASPTLFRLHAVSHPSASHSAVSGVVSPAASSATFPASNSTSHNSSTTARPTGTTPPMTNSLQNAETSSSSSSPATIKVSLGMLSVALIMASTALF